MSRYLETQIVIVSAHSGGRAMHCDILTLVIIPKTCVIKGGIKNVMKVIQCTEIRKDNSSWVSTNYTFIYPVYVVLRLSR